MHLCTCNCCLFMCGYSTDRLTSSLSLLPFFPPACFVIDHFSLRSERFNLHWFNISIRLCLCRVIWSRSDTNAHFIGFLKGKWTNLLVFLSVECRISPTRTGHEVCSVETITSASKQSLVQLFVKYKNKMTHQNTKAIMWCSILFGSNLHMRRRPLANVWIERCTCKCKSVNAGDWFQS